MAYNPIFTGTVDNDDTGDTPKAAGTKINNMFQELYNLTSTIPSNTKTANYTLALADAGTTVEMNVATANTVTVPANATVAFPVNTVIEIAQIGAGTTTIAAATNVTLRYTDTLALRKQWASATLRKRATNEWHVSGDLT